MFVFPFLKYTKDLNFRPISIWLFLFKTSKFVFFSFCFFSNFFFRMENKPDRGFEKFHRFTKERWPKSIPRNIRSSIFFSYRRVRRPPKTCRHRISNRDPIPEKTTRLICVNHRLAVTISIYLRWFKNRRKECLKRTLKNSRNREPRIMKKELSCRRWPCRKRARMFTSLRTFGLGRRVTFRLPEPTRRMWLLTWLCLPRIYQCTIREREGAAQMLDIRRISQCFRPERWAL